MSETSVEVLLVSSVWWIAFSVEIHNLPSLVSSAIGMVSTIVTLVVLARLGRLSRRAPLAMAAAIGVLALVRSDPTLIGSVAAATGAAYSIPQALRLHRRLGESVEGVSLGAWALTGLNGLTWLVYGVIIGHPLLGISGVISVPNTIWICTTVVRRRARPTTLRT